MEKEECEASSSFESSTTATIDSELSDEDNDHSKVYRVSWYPEDHLNELVLLLKGVAPDEVEKCLIHYMEENIEPTGWSAVWRVTKDTAITNLGIDISIDLQVNVVNVSRDKLEADVYIQDVCPDQHIEEEIIAKVKGKTISAPVLQLYPLVKQGNPLINIAATAEVVEQMRFFYSHIWQPWDNDEEYVRYDEFLIKKRLKIFQDISNEVIPPNTSVKMGVIKRKASIIRKQIEDVEHKSGVCEDDDLDERYVVALLQLHRRMDRLKSQYDSLQDPILRQLTAHHRQMEHWNVAGEDLNDGKATIRIVVDSLPFRETLIHLSNLSELKKSLPWVPSLSPVRSFPTLQLALDTSRTGDIIILLPGRHIIYNLGLLNCGGTLCGLGKGVIVQGSADVGDVMLDLTLDNVAFNLFSLLLQPLPGQLAITQHSGTLNVNDCAIEGGDQGLLLLADSLCTVKNSHIIDCSYCAVDCRGTSQLTLDNCRTKSCPVAVQFDAESQVSLQNCLIQDGNESSLCVIWSNENNMKEMCKLPQNEQLEKVFKKYKDIQLDSLIKLSHRMERFIKSNDANKSTNLNSHLFDDVFVLKAKYVNLDSPIL